MTDFQINEKHLSQIPALQLLIGLGYEYLTPAEALRERKGTMSNVLLENILRTQLKEINRIRYKGSDDYLKWICGFANAQGGDRMMRYEV